MIIGYYQDMELVQQESAFLNSVSAEISKFLRIFFSVILLAAGWYGCSNVSTRDGPNEAMRANGH